MLALPGGNSIYPTEERLSTTARTREAIYVSLVVQNDVPVAAPKPPVIRSLFVTYQRKQVNKPARGGHLSEERIVCREHRNILSISMPFHF